MLHDIKFELCTDHILSMGAGNLCNSVEDYEAKTSTHSTLLVDRCGGVVWRGSLRECGSSPTPEWSQCSGPSDAVTIYNPRASERWPWAWRCTCCVIGLVLQDIEIDSNRRSLGKENLGHSAWLRSNNLNYDDDDKMNTDDGCFMY